MEAARGTAIRGDGEAVVWTAASRVENASDDADDSIAGYVRRVVANAPPLSPRQQTLIAELLAPTDP